MAYARLTSYPPLELLTVVPPGEEEINISLLFDWSMSRPNYLFDVVLCYTSSDSSIKHPSLWSSVPLQKCKNPYMPEREDAFRSTYQTLLTRGSLASNTVWDFTFKYRVNSTAPWQWVQLQDGTKPGRLVLQTPATALGDQGLKSYMDLGSVWQVQKLSNADQKTSVYRLESQTSITRSDQGETEDAFSFQVLGKVKGQLQYMALVRLEPYWLGPRHGTGFFHLEEHAVLCSFLLSSGTVLTIITICGVKDTYSVLQSNEKGQVVVAARCDSDDDVHFCALASVGDTFEESSTAVMKAARDMINKQPGIEDLAALGPKTSNPARTDNEDWLDSLSFCTWNGLGQDLTESKILSALDCLAQNKINISTLLIDDCWQDLGPIPDHEYSDSFNRGFRNLVANSSVAPNGLRNLVQKIRSAHPQIRDIGVWHALMGYWGCIAPDGQIARDYQTLEVPALLMGNISANLTSVGPDSLQKFYDDLYTYLSQAGITFVKTDVQHMLSTFRSRSSRRALITAYQRAWTTSYLVHFGGRAISCMSQIPETLWYSLLQTHTPPVVLRNSDDFYPEVAASHPWHIWTNAHNALFTMHLNVVPDWDMFQTKHSFSAYHAAARCISGGPILITDTPGEHDVNLIRQITALDARGRSIALRPGLARTIRVFDEYTDGNVLKVGSTTNSSCSMLGLWNIAERDVSTLVALSEFRNASTMGEKVIARSYRSGQVFGPFETSVLSGKQGLGVDSLIYSMIPVREWDILTLYPIQTSKLGERTVEVAALGLVDKMSGAAGILETSTVVAQNGVLLTKIKLKALGKLGVWISVSSIFSTPHVKSRLVNGGAATDASELGVDAVLLTNSQGDVKTLSITVDLETEWTDRKLLKSESVEDIQVELQFDV